MTSLRDLKARLFTIIAFLSLRKTCLVRFNRHLLPSHSASWPISLQNPSGYYLNCVRFFYQGAPPYLRAHRSFFLHDHRGFGEDAFHVMWHALFAFFRPESFLEIGVYRGQTLSLASLCSKEMEFPCSVSGVSPFTESGDSVSVYQKGLNYYEDTLKNFRHFELPTPNLIRGFSTDSDVLKFIRHQKWPMIYIDGNHDYHVAREDFINCASVLTPQGIIVLDDSGLSTTFDAPFYATRGHPGPSKLATEVPGFGFREVLQVGHNRVFQKIS